MGPITSIRNPPGENAMQTSIAGLLELSLVFGSVLALLIWELVSVRRSQRRDEEQARQRMDEESGK